MSGKLLGSILIAFGLVAGIFMYWLQVYAFYDRVTLASEGGPVTMRVTTPDGVNDLAVADFRAIDADSSPIRFRACFTVDPSALADAVPYDDPVPLNAPGWFDCFDAGTLGADVQSGAAKAVMGEANVTFGIDRIIAVYPDGRAFAWHQINECGEEVFDGRPAPAGCPPAPEETS